ncbi:MAG: undecaprenyl-diphosphate phosphatase [Actinobacteria bacterium]|nr:undecaprenyl-diphosphate phosphatase [Actinomycetota bacterium]MBI3686693.1 undecaprenyl-diphosphate phosphatase [Actinomycetota bacterium]
MTALTYPEALVVGLFQGVAELFPVSSLGHSVLVPALVGGRWARDLDVSSRESPYLAFVVGLHVATALALLAFFWRDWVRIIGGFLTSLRDRQVRTPDQRLAWLLIVATIPVGLAGLVLERTFRTTLGRPIPAAIFLAVNGAVLFGAERLRRSTVMVPATGPSSEYGTPGFDPDATMVIGRGAGHATPPGRHREPAVVHADGFASDHRLARLGLGQGTLVGAAQILALLPGISRSGITMAAGLLRGLSHEDAARFSFLLATPVILAAGALKLPDLAGPLTAGIHGQVLLGSLASGIGAYFSVRFLTRYFETRTLTPFAIYCTLAGLGSLAWLTLR